MDSLKRSTAELPGSGNVLLLGVGLALVGCLLVVIVFARMVVWLAVACMWWKRNGRRG